MKKIFVLTVFAIVVFTVTFVIFGMAIGVY
jgi:hypothetical protein